MVIHVPPERFTLQSGGSVASLVSHRPALAREVPFFNKAEFYQLHKAVANQLWLSRIF